MKTSEVFEKYAQECIWKLQEFAENFPSRPITGRLDSICEQYGWDEDERRELISRYEDAVKNF